MSDPSSPTSGGPFKNRVRRDKSWTASLIGSYVFDWVVLILVAIGGGVLAIVEPNKRPFSLLDPNISFPFTEKETVPIPILLIINFLAPVVIIFVICLVFVPGNTVPKGTPRALLWKRKLWELHVGWLGLALAIDGAWFITNGMKNMFGRPRPDLLSRCQPDLANFGDYVVGGIAREDIPSGVNQVLTVGMLVSAKICQQTDSHKLDDGFRSYPSGHSSSAAAGLIYLSLFLASKFAVTIPFSATSSDSASTLSAFPSRLTSSKGADAGVIHSHNKMLTSVRRQAAAPPLYLLVLTVVPFFTSVFIAGSRWFDFRHHAFDIIFGYLIGVGTSIFSFYYYHLPIRRGAGWAWGPRSHDKAWWSGVGSYSYATDHKDYVRAGDEEEALNVGASGSPDPNGYGYGAGAATGSNGQFGGHQKEERHRGSGGSGGNPYYGAAGAPGAHEERAFGNPDPSSPSAPAAHDQRGSDDLGRVDPYDYTRGGVTNQEPSRYDTSYDNRL